MDEPSGLLAAADQYLEENRFAEARDAYREVLLRGQSSSRAIINSSVAELEEELAFRRRLADAHPENIQYQLMLAQKMIASRYASHAHLLCGKLLRGLLAPKDDLVVRRLRFKAALLAGRFEFVLEDLAKLWNPAEPVPGSARFRPALIREIAELSNADTIPVLQSIMNEPWVEKAVAKFLVLKIDELQAAAAVIDACAAQRSSGGEQV